MSAILNVMSGYKTYIMAVLYGIDAMGAQLGWWDADTVRNTLEQVFTVIFLRAGVAASAPK